MSYERSKAPLALMEQIIMILVFALTAAVCLQAFVYSNSISQKSLAQNIAANHAQEVAEYVKDIRDVDAVCQKLSGQRTEEGAIFFYPEDKMEVHMVLNRELSNEYMLYMKLSVVNEKEEPLFSIDVACQRQRGGQQ